MTSNGSFNGAPRVIVVDTRAGPAPGLETVDALARFKLVAQRLGVELRLLTEGGPLSQLIVLVGLEDVLICLGDSHVEGGRETEPFEKGSVEEVVDVDDPPT